MIRHARTFLPVAGVSLLVALALAGCDRKSDQTVPAAENSVAAVAAPTDTINDGATDSAHEMNSQEEMERYHRQAMDHDAMRAGGMNQSAPATDAEPTNSAMPMKDM